MDLNTPNASKVVGSLGLLAVAALGWTLVVGPETTSLSDTRAEVDAARQQNAALLVQLSDLEQQQDELKKTRKAAEELATKFPPTADQPGLFEQVTEAAVDAGIGPNGVTTLAPTPPVIGSESGGVSADQPAAGSGTLASQDVSIAVTGSYDQTLRLLENLEHMPRAYLITSVALSGSGTDDAADLTTTIAGHMFVMPPTADPGDDDSSDGNAQETAQTTVQTEEEE
jgi:Tfp pilus assembly protein PilO